MIFLDPVLHVMLFVSIVEREASSHIDSLYEGCPVYSITFLLCHCYTEKHVELDALNIMLVIINTTIVVISVNF